jgi:polyisoprenoid-binding protein YceI
MKSKRLFLITYLLCIFFTLRAQKQLTPLDGGSKVHFVIRNFGIKTGGDFTGLKGTVKFDPQNPLSSFFDVTVNASTIDTDNSTRDGHLRKEEYFDVNKFPVIRMQSAKVLATTKQGRYQFSGNLTIKGITKPIQFQFVVAEKDGGYLFTSDAITINRRDFKVGGSSISMADELKFTLSVLAK